MSILTDPAPPSELAPVPSNERIQALDAVRGFALIGICLMNIEFFNRAIATLGTGMPTGLTGIDYAASFFVQFFVAGKFWTIFSLLFGMGFAVMLTRAEQANREFLKPYMRRIAALAVFGTLHHIFLFAGDILLSYAVAAVFLMVTLYGNWKGIVGAIVALIAIAFIPHMGQAGGMAATTTAFAGLIALYLRSEKKVKNIALMPFILLVIGIGVGIAGIVMMAGKFGPPFARPMLIAASAVLLLLAYLGNKFHDPVSKRPWRAGASIYLFSFTMMTIGGVIDYVMPPQPVTVAAKADVAPKAGAAAKKAEPDPAAERAKRLKERAEKVANEIKVYSTGSYWDVVKMRATAFPEHAAGESGFATVLIGMFLLGTWFVRSGVMEKTGAYLPLFRKLAFIGLPLGIGLGLLGATIATSHVPGAEHDGFQLASGLLMLGNLPASLGYVSMIVLMLHSSSVFSKVKVLAPFGRMALTNYLTQSLVMSTLFFGYGLGYWGMARSTQLVVGLSLCAVQIAFSHWWLARFRYGPAEWVWRAITYMKIPAMRIEETVPGMVAPMAR